MWSLQSKTAIHTDVVSANTAIHTDVISANTAIHTAIHMPEGPSRWPKATSLGSEQGHGIPYGIYHDFPWSRSETLTM